jgi:hypothetical protein
MSESFRKEQIEEIKNVIRNEIIHRTVVKNKYRKAKNVITIVHKVCSGLTMASGISSIITTSTFIIPAAIVCDGVLLLSTFMIIVTNSLNDSWLLKKILKHMEIEMLAQTTLDKIDCIISESLDDNTISNDEFQKIKSIYEAYHKTKYDIRIKYKNGNSGL